MGGRGRPEGGEGPDLPIPTSFKITPSNEWDGKFLVELTEESKELLKGEEKGISALVADAGYDCTENTSYLLTNGITPMYRWQPQGQGDVHSSRKYHHMP